jgi:hypothetical protein
LASVFLNQFQVFLAGINGKEDLLAVITALDNMMREINCNDTSDSGHKGYFAKTMP